MQKLVSVVLPVYNGEKYLALAIESVLNQTYQNIELILVNDCSTDSSESIMLSYQEKDSRVVYVKNEVNSKLPASLNNGFSKARGVYYTWTSDDNLYHPDAIEKMAAYLEEHPDVGMVCCDYNQIEEDGQLRTVMQVGGIDRLIFENVVGACFLYRADVAKAIGEYREDLFLAEDYDYWLRISERFRMDCLHEVLYDYRFHSTSLTTTRRKDVQRVLGDFLWGRLAKYEAGTMPDDRLFDYFDWILTYRGDYPEKARLMFGFSIRHPKYFPRMAKALAHDTNIFLRKQRKKWRRRCRKAARKLLGEYRCRKLKDLKNRLCGH